MDSVSNTLSVFLLHVVWRINIVYDKYFGEEESLTKALPSTVIKQNYTPTLLKESKSKPKIALDPNNKPSYYSRPPEPLTPVEQEMLKFSCAKGYSDENTFSRKLRNYKDEVQIPRSMFTAMWIESCVK